MNQQPKLKKEISGVGGISGSITPMGVKNNAKVVNKTSNIVKPSELTEEAYPGNIGFHEMILFGDVAKPEHWDELERLMGDLKGEKDIEGLAKVWNYVEEVVGRKLVRNKDGSLG